MNEHPALIHPHAQIFAEYWRSLPKRDFLPDRDQIDLYRLRHILSSFVILQRESPTMIRFRLAGTEEVKRYGFEVTGRNYLDFVPHHRRQEVVSTFETMLGLPCGSRHLIESVTSAGRIIHNEAIGYPIRGSDGKADQMIFQSNDLDGKISPFQRTDIMAEHRRILERHFIDIGAGLPAAG